MQMEKHVELKTEAASESVLRSSLFKEQTARLLQKPSRGNDRLTQKKKEGHTHTVRKRRKKLI